MKKNMLIVCVLALTCVIASGRGRGGRYNFGNDNKADVIAELNKRLRVVDSNLVFDGQNLAITLPGPKGDKGDTGQAGVVGQSGRDGIDGIGIQGRPGAIPAHKWDGTRLRFQNSDGTWGKYVDLLGARGRSGIQGKTGRTGQDGIDGVDGKPGRNGKNGIDGNNGQQGIVGPAGRDGTDGLDGQGGQNGASGVQGVPGEDAILPPFVTIQVLTDVKKASNGRLVKTYQDVKVYIE